MLRSVITTVAEVAGLTLISVGSFMVWTPFGFIVTGVGVTALGYLAAGEQ